MYKLECPFCEDYKDGKCIDWECPCVDVPWEDCHIKTMEYAKDRDVEIKTLKEQYKNTLDMIKHDVELLHLFSIQFHVGKEHLLADFVQQQVNKVRKIIQEETSNEQDTDRN